MVNNDNTIPTLELQRIPHVGRQIFEYVGTPDLLQFRKVSETWKEIAEIVLVKRWRDNWSKAIVETDLQANFEVLEKKPNIQIRDVGWVAAFNNEIEYSIIKSLMEHPNANNIQDINRMMRQVKLPNNTNPLLYACNFGNLKVVKLLLDYSGISEDIDLNVKEYWERRLLRKEPGWTGFTRACKNGHVDVVELFLNHSKTFKIDLNTRDCIEWTALHYACSKGHTKVVELLLNHSEGEEIDFNARNIQGETAFILACQRGHIDVVRLLLDNSAIKNIDLTIEDHHDGWNGFMWSCRTRHSRRAVELLRLFLDHPEMENIDLTIGSHSGLTALMIACQIGHDQVVSLLLDYSGSKDIGLNIRDNSGKTAFMLACTRPATPTTNVIRLFLEHSESKKIHLNLRDNDGMTGFMLAYRSNILMDSSLPNVGSYVAELLLKNSAEKNIELPLDALEYPGTLVRAIEARKVRKFFQYLPF